MTTVLGIENGAKYEIVGPDGTRVVFNDPTDVDHVGFLDGENGTTGLDGAEVRESADDIVEGDGGVHGDFFLGRRPFTFNGIIDPVARFPDEWTDTLTELERNRALNPRLAVDLEHYSQVDSGGYTLLAGHATRSALPVAAGSSDFAYRVHVSQPADATTRTSGLQSPSVVGDLVPVVEGQTYTIIAELYVDSWTQGGVWTGKIDTSGFDAGGAGPIGSQTGSLKGLVLGWNRISQTFVIPAGAALMRINPEFRNATASMTIDGYITRIMVVDGDRTGNLPAFFDGDTLANAYPYRTVWTGGAQDSASTYNIVTRTFDETAEIVNARINKLRRAIGRARRDDLEVSWQTRGGDPVQIEARAQQPLRITGRHPKNFQIACVAADPLIYSQSLNVASVNAAAGGSGGFSSPLRSPLGSGASPAGQLFVTNDGSEDVYPLITVYGPASNPTIVNTTTGESMRFIYTLLAGEYLEIDTKNGTVKLNGTADRDSAFDFLSSVWIRLVPGLNDLRILFSSFSAGAQMNVAWRDAWN